jgi:hypothetical protein
MAFLPRNRLAMPSPMLALVLRQALLEAGEEAGLTGFGSRCSLGSRSLNHRRRRFNDRGRHGLRRNHHGLGHRFNDRGRGWFNRQARCAGALRPQAAWRSQALRPPRFPAIGIGGTMCGACTSSTNATGSSGTGNGGHGSCGWLWLWLWQQARSPPAASGAGRQAAPRALASRSTGSATGAMAGSGRTGSGTGSGWTCGCSTTASCGFLRSHPNRPFFSPALQLGSSCRRWNQTWRTAISSVATRHCGASVNNIRCATDCFLASLFMRSIL